MDEKSLSSQVNIFRIFSILLSTASFLTLCKPEQKLHWGTVWLMAVLFRVNKLCVGKAWHPGYARGGKVITQMFDGGSSSEVTWKFVSGVSESEGLRCKFKIIAPPRGKKSNIRKVPAVSCDVSNSWIEGTKGSRVPPGSTMISLTELSTSHEYQKVLMLQNLYRHKLQKKPLGNVSVLSFYEGVIWTWNVINSSLL